MITFWTSGESPLGAFGPPGHKDRLSYAAAMVYSGRVKVLGFRLESALKL